jgi:hypothetical protein
VSFEQYCSKCILLTPWGTACPDHQDKPQPKTPTAVAGAPTSTTWACLTCNKTAVTRDALRWLCTCIPAVMCWEQQIAPQQQAPFTEAERLEEMERAANEEEMLEGERQTIREEVASHIQPEVMEFDDDAAFADHLEKYLDAMDDEEAVVTPKEKRVFVSAFIERLETPGEYSLGDFVADQRLSMRKAKPLILAVLRAHKSWSKFTVTQRRVGGAR